MKKFRDCRRGDAVCRKRSGAYAQGTASPGDQTSNPTSHHKAKTNMKPGTTTGSAMRSSRKPMAGDNDERKGNSATSAGGSNSLSNTNPAA